METEPRMSGTRWVLTVGIPGLIVIFVVFPALVAGIAALVGALRH